MNKKTIFLVTIPGEVTDRLNRYVDGDRYRSMTHLVISILSEWIRKQERKDQSS